MWLAPYIVLIWLGLVLWSTFASEKLLTVFELPVNEAGDKYDYIEYSMENTQIISFSICFYFKPTYQLNLNHQVLLQIPDFIKIGLYKDSVGGWLQIGKEYKIFDFPAVLYPRTWSSLCIQQTLTELKIWHENQTIFTENMIELPSFNTQVFMYNIYGRFQ